MFFNDFWGLYMDVWNMLHFRVGILVLEMLLDMLQQPALYLGWNSVVFLCHFYMVSNCFCDQV